MWVQTVSVSRHYGGPEEGGWYYNRYVVHAEKKLKKRRAKKAAKRLKETMPPPPKYSIYSVLGNEPEYFVNCSDYRFETTRKRPRYE